MTRCPLLSAQFNYEVVRRAATDLAWRKSLAHFHMYLYSRSCLHRDLALWRNQIATLLLLKVWMNRCQICCRFARGLAKKGMTLQSRMVMIRQHPLLGIDLVVSQFKCQLREVDIYTPLDFMLICLTKAAAFNYKEASPLGSSRFFIFALSTAN